MPVYLLPGKVASSFVAALSLSIDTTQPALRVYTTTAASPLSLTEDRYSAQPSPPAW